MRPATMPRLPCRCELPPSLQPCFSLFCMHGRVRAKCSGMPTLGAAMWGVTPVSLRHQLGNAVPGTCLMLCPGLAISVPLFPLPGSSVRRKV